jgi:tetratricopeptide (TPR) repeat protein
MRGRRRNGSAILAAFIGLVAATGCSRDPEVAKREYLQSGDRYAAEKKYHEAIVEYRNAIQQDSRFGEARYKLAETYVQLGDASNAYREYVRAADLLPDDVTAQIKATQMLLLAGEYETAKARVEVALANDPKNIEAQILRANALAGLKNFDAAVTEMEAAIKLDPDRSVSYANLGTLELARGNRAEAEAAFKRAIETEPQSVLARLSLGNFYWATGRMNETEQTLKDALSLDPKNLLANRALAIMHLASNRAPEAEPYLQAVVQISGTSGAKLWLADYYRAVSREPEARKILDGLRNDEGSFTPVRLRLAAMAVATKQVKEADKLIDEIVQKNPKDVEGLIAKAKLLMFERRFGEALAKAEAALAIDSRASEAQFVMGKLRVARQEWDEAIAAFTEVTTLAPRAMNARLELTAAYLRKGDREGALQIARETVGLQPKSAEARLMLSRVLLVKGDASGAEPHVNLLSANFAGSPDVQSQVGQLQALKKNRAAARAAFERALVLNPDQFDALAGLVSLDLESNQPAVARGRVEAKLSQRRDDSGLLMLAAQTYLAGKDKKAAEETLRRAVDVDSSNLQAYMMLGQLYASEGRLDEARVEFERLTTLQPKEVSAPTMAAMILHMQNKVVEARARYEKVMEVDPQAAVAANNLAWLYAEGGGNLDLALQLAQTAKAKLPTSPEVNDTLGWIYYKKNLPELAIPLLQESVAAAPANPVFHYHLGLAYSKKGDEASARHSLDRALKSQPSPKDAVDIRASLETLGR